MGGRFVNSQGAEHVINWELASTPEYRQMMSKYKQIAEYMQPPYFIETVKKEAAKTGDEELSDAERADQEKVEQVAPKASKKKSSGETVEKPVRASYSTTCSMKDARNTRCSATRAWAK